MGHQRSQIPRSPTWISKDGKTVCNYDRGWDIEPKKGSDAEKAMQQVLEMYKG